MKTLSKSELQTMKEESGGTVHLSDNAYREAHRRGMTVPQFLEYCVGQVIRR